MQSGNIRHTDIFRRVTVAVFVETFFLGEEKRAMGRVVK